MANPYAGLTVELDGNVSDFSRALREARKQAEGTSKELKQLQSALKVDPTNAKLLAQTQETYQKKLKATQDQLELLKKKEQEILNDPRGKNSVASETWTKLQADIARCETDVQKYGKAIRDLNVEPELEAARKKTKETTDEVERLSKSLKLDPGNVELIAQKQDALKRAVEATTDELEALRKKEQEIGKENMSTAEWTNLQADIHDCEIAIENYEDEIKQLGKTTDQVAGQMGDKLQAAGEKIQAGSQKLQSFGDAYTRTITLPMAAAGAAAIKSAVDIDSSLTDVRKTVDATEEEYQALKEAALEFSQTNAVEPAQILTLQALGAQLGFSKDELAEFAEVASGLDIATDMNAEDASTEMAQFANITQMAHEDIRRYASTIVNLGNNMATTESQVSSMAQRIGAAGHQVGMSHDQILAWAGAMSSLGIEAEAGGTAFSTTVANIDKAVALGGENLEKYAAIAGMSAEDFSNAWRTSASDTMEHILNGLQGAENMSVALEDLGISGIRQTDVMKRLAGNTELVGDAMDYAAKGWEENVALTNEVENRNSSLASKFQILKNRVVAVADDVGGPLADALLDAIDAAAPLFDAIKDGAKQFKNMSKEEQQMVIQAAAAVAGLGPLLSMVGRIGGGVGSAVSALGSLGKGLGNLVGDAGKAAGAVEGVSKAAGAASGAAGLLKGGLIGLGVAAAAVVAALAIKAWMDYQHELELTADAAMDLSEMESKAKGELDNYRDALEETTKKTKELREEQAQSNNDFIDTMKALEGSAGVAERYADIIDDLTHKGQLTAKEQEKLKIAVDGFNEATGQSIQILDAENGIIDTSTAVLRLNTEEWKKNQKVKAYEDKYADAIKQQVDAEMELEEAVKQLSQAQADYNEIVEITRQHPELAEAYQWAIYDASKALQDAQTNVDNLNQVIANSEKQQIQIENAINNTNRAFEVQKTDIEKLTGTILSYGDQSIQKLAATGWTVEDLTRKLYDQGVRADDLKTITARTFDEMWASCNGDINLMIQKIEEYNRQQFREKMVPISADTSEYDRKVEELRRMTLPTKYQKIEAYMTTPRKTAWGTNYLIGNAAGGIFKTKNILDSIPKHAKGGIVDHPTLTSAGWVGEAGAEAIIPLTNQKYAEPLARTIAKFLPNGGDTYLVIDGATVNANNEIKQMFLDLFTELYRKGEMNRGNK